MASQLIAASLVYEDGSTSPNDDLVDGDIDGAIRHKTQRKRKDSHADGLTPPKRMCTAANSLFAIATENKSRQFLQCKIIPL